MIKTINSILKRFVGDKSKKDLQDITPVVAKINEIGNSLQNISHDELRQRSENLKAQIRERIKGKEDEVATLKQQAEELPGTELEQKEALYNKVDKLTKEIDEEIEKVLEEILPEAFAIVKETARRLKENAG